VKGEGKTMLPEKDEVIIAVSLHELDFVSVLRAARLLGATRENVVKQAVTNYLLQMQKQGLDVGIQLPPEPENKPADELAGEKKEKASKGSDGKDRGRNV
jgi:hypothetical protein